MGWSDTSITNQVYMIAIKFKDESGLRWYCTGRPGRPFATFNLSSAKREATKLRHCGYTAAIVTANVMNQTCLIDIKNI